MRKHKFRFIIAGMLLLLAAIACGTQPTSVNPDLGQPVETEEAEVAAEEDAEPTATESSEIIEVAEEAVDETEKEPNVFYALETVVGGDPAMSFVGVGGDINGVTNPQLTASVGDVVQLTVINGSAVLHDLAIDEFNVSTGEMTEEGQEVVLTFEVSAPGEFTYYCSIPGHQLAGMEGKLLVVGEVVVGEEDALDDSVAASGGDGYALSAGPAAEDAVSIIRNPADLPAPLEPREATTVQVELETIEVTGQLADGTTYNYFTFGGKVPGPMIRIREGDTVEFTLKNEDGSVFPHSIDLHAVTGPGGGAVYTQTNPGEETGFTFKALQPGLFVYHCATASIPHHISNGMYGMILVEPEGGLPPVDREFYVMQGEVYTAQKFGTEGHLDFSADLMGSEEPEFFVFNGSAGGLATDEYALRANVGETVRIYFGVGGPNFISSFHVIGEIFDRVYDQASLTTDPMTDVQTTIVPPGGATMVEFALEVPGRYILVDHALSRLEHGLVGFLYAEGDDAPDIFAASGLPEESDH